MQHIRMRVYFTAAAMAVSSLIARLTMRGSNARPSSMR
jgi:hypothetical protein